MDEATYRSGYRAARQLLEPLGADDLMRPCPQCPGWTIRDVVAHVVHVFAARVDGGWPDPIAVDMVAVATHPDRAERRAAQRRRDDWIEAGVEGFRHRPGCHRSLGAGDRTGR